MLFRFIFTLTYFFSLILSSYTWAQQLKEIEFVVADHGFNSSSRILLNKEDIRKSQAQNLSELLSRQANIIVSSSLVEPNSIFIRGGDSSHVLILVDGVPIYDTSTIQRTADLSSVNLLVVKKIEIIKGSQSVIYGGQALAAVIKIETDFNPDKSGEIEFQGNQKIQQSKLVKNFKIDERQTFLIGAVGNLGSTQSPVENSKKNYSVNTYSLQGLYSYAFEQNQFFIKGLTSVNNQKIPTVDDLTSKPIDVESYETKSQLNQLQMGINFNRKTQFFVTQNYNQRTYNLSLNESPNGYSVDEKYNGELSYLSFHHELIENKIFNLELGGNFNFEKLKYVSQKQEKTNANTQFEGLFVKSQLELNKDIQFEIGARSDTQKGDFLATTYQTGLNYQKWIYYEYATGFKAPSLFQMYSSYGQVNLQAEKSITQSVRIDAVLSDEINHSITLYETRFSDLIDYDSVKQKYSNYKKTKTNGVEYQLNFAKNSLGYAGQFAFNYQEPIDEINQQWLPHRPLTSTMILIDKAVSDQLKLGIEYKHTGARADIHAENFQNQTSTLPSYDIFNFYVKYKFMKNYQTFLRINNLFNQSYQSSYQYFGLGREYDFGLSVLF